MGHTGKEVQRKLEYIELGWEELGLKEITEDMNSTRE